MKLLQKRSSENQRRRNHVRHISMVTAVLGFVFITGLGTPSAGGNGSEESPSERYESKFYGTVEKLPQGMVGTWVINKRDIAITKETRISERHGKATPGAYVEVEGINTGNAFTAHKIVVKRSKR